MLSRSSSSSSKVKGSSSSKISKRASSLPTPEDEISRLRACLNENLGVPRQGERIPALLLSVGADNIFRLMMPLSGGVAYVTLKLDGIHLPDVLSSNELESRAGKLVHSHILCLTHMHEIIEIKLMSVEHHGLYVGDLYLGPGDDASLTTTLLKHRLATTKKSELTQEFLDKIANKIVL